MGFGGSYFYTTLSRARAYGNFPDNKISAIAIGIKNGYTPETVRDNINSAIPGIRAWKTDDLRSSTVRFLLPAQYRHQYRSLVIFAIISDSYHRVTPTLQHRQNKRLRNIKSHLSYKWLYHQIDKLLHSITQFVSIIPGYY